MLALRLIFVVAPLGVHATSGENFFQLGLRRLTPRAQPDDEKNLPKVLWGIESNANPAYEKIVEAQLETWAKDIPREQLVVVGGKFDDDSVVVGGGAADWADTVSPNPCPDARANLNCKEALLLDRGVERAKRLNADWLMVGQEDKYLWPKAVQKALLELDASKPQVMGSFGCGQGWKYHADSKNGTVPFPDHWIEPTVSCKAVYENGGLCGGPTFYVSRAALNLLKKEGQSSHDFLAEYMASASGNSGASDLYSSCMFYSRGITMVGPLRNSFINLDGNDVTEVKNRIEKSEMVLGAHLSGLDKATLPDLIRKLHALSSTPARAFSALLSIGGAKVISFAR